MGVKLCCKIARGGQWTHCCVRPLGHPGLCKCDECAANFEPDQEQPKEIKVDVGPVPVTDCVELAVYFRGGSIMRLICPQQYAQMQFDGLVKGRWNDEIKDGYTTASATGEGVHSHAFLINEVIGLTISPIPQTSELHALQEKILRKAAEDMDSGEEWKQ